MNAPRPLVPPPITGRARSLGHVSFAFGPRFFVMLLLGLLWLVPAWWSPQLIAAMFLWDLLAILAFISDLGRLPKPSQIEVRRLWEQAPCLATPCDVALSLRNFGGSAIRCFLIDETPVSFRDAPPSLELIVGPGGQAQTSYQILPRERGDVGVGRLFIRYQSKLAFAQRWATADISQTVRVLPDLQQARQHALYLIRSRQVEMEKRRRRQRGHGREFDSS